MATGVALSDPFQVTGDWLVFRVAGAYAPQRAFVALELVEGGRELYRATGRNSEMLGRVRWDLRPHRGQAVRLRIVDDMQGSWGHIVIDEIAQWRATASGQPSDPR